MNRGKIIEYIDQGRVICTICLQDKGNRFHLLTSSNREVRLSPNRALLISSSAIETLSPRAELLHQLKHVEELRNLLQEKVQVKELWELVREEKESFGHKYLAQLCFGAMVTDDHISALVRAMFEDRLYFKMKDSRFLPNSEERVEQIVKQREEDALRDAQLKQGSAWLKEVFQNRMPQEPPCKDAIINLLIELALYGREAPNFKYGKELLLRAEITDIQLAKNLLINLGVWEEDENRDLHRLDIRTSFNEKQLNESDKLAKIEIGEAGREDLRNLDAFTIDGPWTRDFDDALSLEIGNDSILIGIHITDVSEVISPDSILNNEASKRGSSLYLLRRQVPMLPPNLSQDTLSLKQGLDRPSISLMSWFDKEGNLLDYRFVTSLIRVKRQLTYDQVEELYKKENQLAQMHRISQLMRQRRINQGALILSLPEVVFEIHSDSSLSFKMVEQETASRTIVAELMIFYNWLSARFCRDNNIPILYRTQEEPGERLLIDEAAGNPYFVFKQRRKLNPLIIDTEPRPHSNLGLDVYTNVSSPIRRYFDLVGQRQIKNFLLNKFPVYSKEEVENIRTTVEPVLKDLERVKRKRIRYWTQKYLIQHIGEKFSALILDTMKKKYRILLTDFLLVAEMRRITGQNFSEGERIMVRVKKSDPWNDLLSLEFAGQ
ncbi:MAG: ribonuclease catalytic domain-containing protein [Desulfatiglandales bacterium]|nr:ribonuclease catalytic domain-containing protein [Desulfatiglandales bacterium]